MSVGKRAHKFHQGLGAAFEDYAHRIIERVAAASRGATATRRPPIGCDTEYCDSLVTESGNAYMFEHKALRPGLQFFEGGSSQRVLGPSASTIRAIDRGGTVGAALGRRDDDGFLHQIHVAALNARYWLRKSLADTAGDRLAA